MNLDFINKNVVSGFVVLLVVNFLTPGGLIYQVSKLFETPAPYVEGRGLTPSQIKNIKNYDRLLGLGVVKRFNEIDWNRHIKVSYFVPLNILVDKNGNQFTQENLFSMLKSYGKQKAEFECQLLLQSLASICEVNEASAKIEEFGKKKKRFVKIWIKLYYVQKTDFGVLPEDVAMKFTEIDNTIYEDRKNLIKASDTKALAAWRIKIYDLIVDACSELKSLRTNCAISRATLHTQFHLRKNRGYLSYKSWAKFAFLE